MSRRALLGRSGGLYSLSIVSVPLGGGAPRILPLGRCASRDVAIRLWLALQAPADHPAPRHDDRRPAE